MPRAVVCRTLGGPESLRVEHFESSALKPGQVRVTIKAAGLNFPDILMTKGDYQLKPDLPFTPGMEAAGDVVEVSGDGGGFAIGDRVIVKLRHGGFADEAVVTAAQLTRLPSTFDYAEGATFLAAHGTAYHALVDRGQLAAGEVLLVHGAGGGVGLAAVELGQALGRCRDRLRVVAGETRRRQSARRGSWRALWRRAVSRCREANHRRQGCRCRVRSGRRRDFRAEPALHELGRAAAGRRVHRRHRVAKTNLVLIKGASVLGVRAGEAVRKNPALGEVRFKALNAWAEERKIRPNVSHRLPLEDVAAAMRLLTDRKAIGRVALVM